MSTMMLSTLLLMAGLTIFAVLIFKQYTKKEESVAEKRIRKNLSGQLDKELQTEEEETEIKKGLFGRKKKVKLKKKPKKKNPTVSYISEFLEGVPFFQEEEGKTFIEKLGKELILAGKEDEMTPYEALAKVFVIWMVGVVALTMLYFLGMFPKWLYIPGVLVAIIYPFNKLKSWKRQRSDSIKSETIVFIMQLQMAISSGMTTIDEALARIASQAEIDPYESVLANEFGRAINKIRNGEDWEESMREVMERIEVLSVDNLIEALIQGRRMGSDLTRILEEYGRSATEIWQQDMRTLKARKEPIITIGMIITLFGGFLLIAGPMLLSLMLTMSVVGGGV